MDGEGGGDATRSGAAAAPFPCQRDNKCTKGTNASYRRKRKLAVREAIKLLCMRRGLEYVGVMTLTFADHVLDGREARRRFRSFRTHVLDVRYPDGWFCVLERQKSGRIHFHVVMVCRSDIRTGANFAQFKRRNYTSANAALRAEWAFARKNAPKYGFGRTEVLPVKRTSKILGSYVGKYLDKHDAVRLDVDKGLHLVSASRGVLPGVRNFSSNAPGAQLFRKKLAGVAQCLGIESLAGFKARYGSKWAWKLRRTIRDFDLASVNGGRITYANVFQARLDGRGPFEELPDDLGPIEVEVRTIHPAPVRAGPLVWTIEPSDAAENVRISGMAGVIRCRRGWDVARAA